MREHNPDKLVSQFIAASAASQSFREEHYRVYEVAVHRLVSFGRQDAVAAILDSQKPFLEASIESFATRLIHLYGRASMPSHAGTTFHDLPPKHKSVIPSTPASMPTSTPATSSRSPPSSSRSRSHTQPLSPVYPVTTYSSKRCAISRTSLLPSTSSHSWRSAVLHPMRYLSPLCLMDSTTTIVLMMPRNSRR
jgi:hypothetical protein